MKMNESEALLEALHAIEALKEIGLEEGILPVTKALMDRIKETAGWAAKYIEHLERMYACLWHETLACAERADENRWVPVEEGKPAGGNAIIFSLEGGAAEGYYSERKDAWTPYRWAAKNVIRLTEGALAPGKNATTRARSMQIARYLAEQRTTPLPETKSLLPLTVKSL